VPVSENTEGFVAPPFTSLVLAPLVLQSPVVLVVTPAASVPVALVVTPQPIPAAPAPLEMMAAPVPPEKPVARPMPRPPKPYRN
jgi:hypothetical protein